MSDTFRLVEKRHDITAIIVEAGPMVSGDIWQVTEDSQRTVYSFKGIHVDVHNEKLVFEIDQDFGFNPLQTVFVRIQHKSLVFKIMPGDYKYFHNKLTAKFPKEGRALELRSELRFAIRPKVFITATMRPAISNTLARVEGRIVDISPNGIGLAINERYKHLVFKDSIFVFLAMAGLELTMKVQGRVMNLPGKVWSMKSGEFKAGIMFDGPLPDDVYKHVIKAKSAGY